MAVHESGPKKDPHGALRFPVYDNAAFRFDSAESMAESFGGRRAAHAYTRITNPTVEAFEHKITALERGFATVAVSSGMAAISGAMLNLLEAGDNIVTASSLFGGTYSYFRNILVPLGIEVRFVPIEDLKSVEEAVNGRTRAIFTETITNPCMIVPDFEGLSQIAAKHGVPLVADSTVTTPYLFEAREFGADIVVHSTTKYFSGGATGMGGVIVDLGTFDWSRIPTLKNYHRFGEAAFIARLRKETCRETGACLSPHNAYLQSLGTETLALRMERLCGNAKRAAEFLDAHRAVHSVNYPGLVLSPFHELARRQFNGLFGGILSMNLSDKAAGFRFLNRLSLVSRASNLGDNNTLALHPASTLFAGFTEEQMKAVGVDDSLIRISFGIEDTGDIVDDIRQALEGEEG
jgi:O-acetylhomoserine (thiol)-lyase